MELNTAVKQFVIKQAARSHAPHKHKTKAPARLQRTLSLATPPLILGKAAWLMRTRQTVNNESPHASAVFEAQPLSIAIVAANEKMDTKIISQRVAENGAKSGVGNGIAGCSVLKSIVDVMGTKSGE